MKLFYCNTAIIVFLVSLISACGTTQPITSSGTNKGQDVLEQALAREASLSGNYPISAQDGFFSASITGSAQPSVQAHEGVYQVSVPIGTEVMAECFIYHEPLDTAATLNLLFDESLAFTEETEIHEIDAGVFDKVPYLYQEKLYLTKQNKVGMLKIFVSPFDSSLLACMHDTAGYRETFRKMASSLAKSLVLHNVDSENWQHEEILVWKLHDMKIGYTLSRAVPDENGDIKSVVETALVIPRSEQETLVHDEYNLTYEQPDGALINGRYSEAENGKLKVNVSLDPNEQGGYQVSGTFQGKEINAPLKSAKSVDGPYYQHREMIRAADPNNSQLQSVHINAYMPSANPLEAVEMDIEPTGEQIDGLPQYEILFAGMKATTLVDNQGHKSMTLEMGQVEIELSRAYINHF